MVYDIYNYSIHGVYKPANITGGGHIVPMKHCKEWDFVEGKPSTNW